MTESTAQTVLIVDGSIKDRSHFKGFLNKRAGQAYSFLEAETEQAALSLCRDRKLDCVLMSSKLPDGERLAFLHALQADPALRQLPVVVLVASEDQAEVASSAYSCGALECLGRQNVSEDELVRATHNALQMGSLRRSLTLEAALRSCAEASLHKHGFARPYLPRNRAPRRALLLLSADGHLLTKDKKSLRWMHSGTSFEGAKHQAKVPFTVASPAKLQEQLAACIARGSAQAMGHVRGCEGGLVPVSISFESLESEAFGQNCVAVTLVERSHEKSAPGPLLSREVEADERIAQLTERVTEALELLVETKQTSVVDPVFLKRTAEMLRAQARRFEPVLLEQTTETRR